MAPHRCAFLPVAAALIAVSSARAATRIVLGDGSATASSSSTAYGDRTPKFAVNGTGLTGEQHTNGSANGTMWMTAGPTAGGWFKIDLGTVFPLDSIRLWNFNWQGYTVRGVKQCNLYVSASATDPGSTFPGSWTLVSNSFVFAQAPGTATYTGEPPLSLRGHSARWVALRIDSSHQTASPYYAGIAEIQVFAAQTPVVEIGAPTAFTDRATVPGHLLFDGGQTTAVQLHWGTTDGGTNPVAWQQSTNLGPRTMGTLVADVPLTPGQAYVLRYSATNADGTHWSQPIACMTAPITVTLPVRADEGSGSVTAVFTRPESAASQALTVRFGLSGTALAGQHYVAPSVSVPFAAAQTQAGVTIALRDNVSIEPDRTLTIGMLAGPAPVTGVSTGTVTLADDDRIDAERSWRRHMNVRLAGYAGSSPLTNFPLVVRLHEGLPGFLYAWIQPGGADLRVTDMAGRLLAHEIEQWDPAGVSTVWVQVPLVTGPATSIRLHWGNRMAAQPGYTTDGGAWAGTFGGVWHLRSDLRDATAWANHGSSHGNVAVTGITGPGQSFNGTTAYVEVPHHASIGSDVATRLTVSAWIKPNASLGPTDSARMLEKGDSYFLLQRLGFSAAILVKTNNVTVETGYPNLWLPSNTWHYLCGSYDGQALRFHLNGTLTSTVPLTGPIDDDRLPLRIGASDDGRYFRGAMDEVRIESRARSDDWIRACYDSQKPATTFLEYGRVQTDTGSVILIY